MMDVVMSIAYMRRSCQQSNHPIYKMQADFATDQPVASEAPMGVSGASQDDQHGANGIAEDMVRTLHLSQHLAA